MITVRFILETANQKAAARYTVQFKKIPEGSFEISREILRAAVWNGKKFENEKTVIDYTLHTEGALFTPKYRFEDLIRHDDENKINLGVARRMAQKENVSFIFGSEGREVFLSAPESISGDYAYIIQALFRYALMDLFVISSISLGVIGSNLLIPFAFRLDFGDTIKKGELPIKLNGPSVVRREHYKIISEISDKMNIILDAMVPGLSLGIYDYGEQLLENGHEGRKIELISKRGETVIPLQYESEGIIKIISVLNALMCVYNNPSMCLVIDELDSGIYEYLLGELLSVFEKGAKGQLIFTSHNLRALEMLNKSSIIFSTTNPANRYIRLQNVKSNNNLRDMYLRSIVLGGQKESVYSETDGIEIGRAFRRAGKVVYDACPR